MQTALLDVAGDSKAGMLATLSGLGGFGSGSTVAEIAALGGGLLLTGGGDLEDQIDKADETRVSGHIVVASGDSSGNTIATYLGLHETGMAEVDVTSRGLDGFKIGTIDLTLADKSKLTPDKAAIEARRATTTCWCAKGRSTTRSPSRAPCISRVATPSMARPKAPTICMARRFCWMTTSRSRSRRSSDDRGRAAPNRRSTGRHSQRPMRRVSLILPVGIGGAPHKDRESGRISGDG